MTCGERSPRRWRVHLYLLVALSGKPAKNPHPRVKVHLGLYARRGRSQQPSNTLIVRFTSTKILQGELFTYLFSGRCKSLTDQNNLAAVAGGAPRIEREVAKYVAVALSGFTA